MTDSPKPAPGGITTFACPHCSGSVEIRAVGLSVVAVCKACGSTIDVSDANYRIIHVAEVKTRATRIPMGARATLFGTLWEVIGYCGMSDGTGNYLWGEYLLFNPYQGFRFLVEDDGHWSFVTMLRKYIPGGGTTDALWVGDHKYRIFNRGDSIVQYVMGEFYWRVHVKDKSHAADYIAPPYFLSMEASGGDVVWSRGEYVEPKVIHDAFALKANLPVRRGIGMNQPGPGQAYFRRMMQLTLCFLAAIVFVQVGLSQGAKPQTIYQTSMFITPSMKGQMVIGDPIDIPEGKGNLEIIGHSNVNNSWLDLYGSLVSDATQESDDFILPVEYYYGYDSDGNWSEGSHTATTVLSRIPGGHYRLLVEADAGAFARGQAADFDITLVRGVPMWGNFWAAVLLLALWPFCLMIRRWYFESRRWQKSDYPPAIYKNYNNQ